MKLKGFLKKFCAEAYQNLITMNELPRPPYDSPLIAHNPFYTYPLSKMSSCTQLQQYMRSSGLLNKLHDIGHMWSWHEEVFHWLFLERVLSKSWGISLDEKAFDRVYHRAIAELSRPTFIRRRIVVLNGFPQFKSRLVLCPGVYLLPTDFQTRDYVLSNLLWHRYQDRNREPSLWLDPRICFLVQDRVIRKGDEGKDLLTSREEMRDQAQLVIKALRLSVDSPVHSKATFAAYLSCFPMLPVAFDEVDEARDISIEVDRAIKRREIQELRKYLSFISHNESQEVSVDQFFYSALDRFNVSFRFRDIKQSIVDLNVALESLFPVGEELRYRLAVSVASLLGINDQDRNNLFRKVYSGYKLRNAIVHGRKDLAGSMAQALKEFFPELEGKPATVVNRSIGNAVRELQLIVRQALRAYIYIRTHSPQSKWPPIAEDFDYLLFDSERHHQIQKQLGIKHIAGEVSQITYWQSIG
jgi:hypothetical protein